MRKPLQPNARYRSHLRQVLRLLDRDKVVEACDLMEKLRADEEQFERFARSPAFKLFRAAVVSTEKSFRSTITLYEASLTVLGDIKADLRRPRRRNPNRDTRAAGAARQASRKRHRRR